MKRISIFLVALLMVVAVSCKKGKDQKDPRCYETPPTNEVCQAYFQSWFYDQKTGSCYKKGYSGCEMYGFATKEECEECDCKENQQKNEPTNDYIVFGSFYGMCGGEECVELFKLGNKAIFEDSKDQYPNQRELYQGAFTTLLSEQDFNNAQDLRTHFPMDLLNETKTVFGMPDAHDQGGYYLEYKKNGVHKFWYIDQTRSRIPEKYHAFLDKMDKKLLDLVR